MPRKSPDAAESVMERAQRLGIPVDAPLSVKDKARLLGIPVKAVEAWEKSRTVIDDAIEWVVHTPPEERLRWLLRFAAETLDTLSTDERITRWERLRTFMVHHATSRRVVGPMPDALLRRLHQEIGRGLRAIVGEQGGCWEIPVPLCFRVYRSSPRLQTGPKGAVTAPEQTRFHVQWDFGENEEGSILAGVIHMVQDVGTRLRGCVECGAPFLAVKRQIYCGKHCSQRSRDKAKQEAKGARA